MKKFVLKLKAVHELQESTMADVTAEAAHFNETDKALPAGSAYAHSVVSEDVIVSPMLAKKDPVKKEGKMSDYLNRCQVFRNGTNMKPGPRV